MDSLGSIAARAAALLKERQEQVSVAETSAGGLIAASLLMVPGASAYFAGGAIPYSLRSVRGLLQLSVAGLQKEGIRSSSEPFAFRLAETVRLRHGNVAWGLAETGAAGPGANIYGDSAGHTCLSVAGPVTLVRTIRTGIDDRGANMRAFANAALALLVEALEASPVVRSAR